VTTSTYDVTISGGDLASFNGTVNLNLSGTQNITDVAGNPLPVGEPTTDDTYTVDNNAPSLTSFTLKTPAASPTNADSLTFLATFSKAVTGVDTGDFVINSSSTATVTNVTPVTTSTYDVTISGGDLAGFNGTINLNLSGTPTISDGAGNTLPTGEPTTDDTYTVDNLAPSLTSFTFKTPAASPTNADSLTFMATFSEAVTGVDTLDFAVNSTTTATVTNVTQMTTSTYDVTISGGDLAGFNGTVNLNLSGTPTIVDGIGNGLPSGEPTTDETYTVDNLAPGIISFTMKTPATSPTNADSLTFLATFSETVTGVDALDFSVNSTTTATITSVTTVTPDTYDVTISGGDLAGFNGAVNLNVSGTPTITDLTGNALPTGEPTIDDTYIVDNSIAPPPPSSAIFADVPLSHWARVWVEIIYINGITGGCNNSPILYCPDRAVTRAEMAIFILRSKYGRNYTPPPATGTVFTDVPLDYYAAWIEQLAAEKITGGCVPDGSQYCPNANITRAEMAIFLLRGKHGSAYTPPPATGMVFGDVTIGSFAADFIEQLFNTGIAAGCGGGDYCPGNPVTRAEMAVFLVKTFNLP
jgi:hypothetical protein